MAWVCPPRSSNGPVPDTTVEAAKLMLWCTLAGFSERLIPDILTSFARDAQRAVKKDPS